MACGCAGVDGAGVAVSVGCAGGVAGGCGFEGFANPWASVACLWIWFEGWLFGGLSLLGPPAISLSEVVFVP